ncbi:MAG TPA: NAD+ synthase [Dehalococcoidia bacterium]|nr:NAD+ synthase [Dehalococcoidia bacterium]
MPSLRVGLAQINVTVGDLKGNVARIVSCVEQARSLAVDLLTFPELAVPGYPPEDLLLRPQFIRDNLDALDSVVKRSAGITLIVGFVDAEEDIYDAAAIIHDGRLVDVYRKQFLPNYGVFDEDRYFEPGNRCAVYEVAGFGVGVNICEDIWYPEGPAQAQAHDGAQVIVNISASPFQAEKRFFRERMLSTRASDAAAMLCYGNLIGGQDELVFDGNSLIVDPEGMVVGRARSFEEDLLVWDLNMDKVMQARMHAPRRRKERPAFAGVAPEKVHVSSKPFAVDKPPLPPHDVTPLEGVAEVYAALVVGTRDYVRKNGFEKVVIGLSGGIDSSFVAAVAVDALGAENVIGVSMPSRFSSPGSRSDAHAVAENLGIRLMTIPIEEAFDAYLKMFSEPFAGTEFGIAEENLQTRVRGNILMGLSNKFGWLVLATGNKSEMATGYSTLYGDMAGGFAVIKDVPKTLVYKLAEYRNSLDGKPAIPQAVLDKVPSAELKPDQADTDTLPPYDVLDPILQAYVEEDKSMADLLAAGFDEETIKRVIAMVDRNEYKRRQAPPGVKITPRAFGRDRRLPIANRYRGW